MVESARDPALAALAQLIDGAHLAKPDDLPSVVLDAGRELGWTAVIYVIDYDQRRLNPMVPADRGLEPREVEDPESTIAGRSFRTVEPVTAPNSQPRLWVPLLDGVERLGVLCIDHPPDADMTDQWWRDRVRWFSHLVGHLLATKGNYGDAIHRARLAQQRTIPSELIWSLLPPQTMACADLIVAGILEPAHSVAGDIFDYSIDAHIAHVTIVDATGHDLRSGIIGALALSAYRSSRRRDLGLDETAGTIDSVLEDFAEDTLATGVLGQLDTTTGVFRYVNAGHPSPLLMRGGKVVKELDGGRRILLGMPGRHVEPAEEHLQPGDLIVLYTDGVVEARDHNREFFGLQRFVDVLERSAANQQPPPETARRAVHAVLDHQRGVLQDDATILVMEWRGGGARQLTAS